METQDRTVLLWSGNSYFVSSWGEKMALSRVVVFCALTCLKFCYDGKIYAEPTESQETTRQDGSNVCHTPECNYMASLMLNRSDPTVNPCEDFYDFACGGFISSTVLPQGATYMHQFNILAEKLKKQLKSVVGEPIGEDDQHTVKLVKTLYKACMNETEIAKLDVDSMKRYFNELGGWPVIASNWSADQFTWYNTTYKFQERGLDWYSLLGFFVGTDLKNSSRRVIHFDAPGFGLDKGYLTKGFNDSIVKAYYQYMVNVTIALGANQITAETEMRSVLDFEVELAKAEALDGDKQNKSLIYNKMTIEELSKKHPSIAWLQYTNVMLAPFYNVTKQEEIVVYAPKFIEKLVELLNTTSNRTVSNYLMWRAMNGIISYLSYEWRKMYLELGRQKGGASVEPPRDMMCMEAAMDRMQVAMGYLYISRYFDKESKNATVEFVTSISKEFDSVLEKTEWLDNTTRSYAKVKADAIRYIIGYPDELENETLVNEYHKELNFKLNSYLDIMLQLNKFDINKAFEKLRKSMKFEAWIEGSNAATVNGFYIPRKNEIKITASLLQGIMFNKTRPKYLSFGGIGFIIAHEISHAFDSVGGQYDAQGNLRDWWTPQTSQHYKNLSKCFLDQYNNITVPEVNLTLRGDYNLPENIADNGGVKTAYKAYLNWTETHGQEPTLPGLNYTTRQLYWLMTANVFCMKQTNEFLAGYIQNNRHAPTKYRINVSLRNSKEFSADWQCPLGSKMNPAHKCAIW